MQIERERKVERERGKDSVLLCTNDAKSQLGKNCGSEEEIG